MSLLDVAGEQLERPGSEEAHQRKDASHVAARATQAAGFATTFSARRAGHRRFRLQVAGAVALTFVIGLAWVLPSQNVRIAVDGLTLNVSSRAESPDTIARQAGVNLEPGDTVQQLEDDALSIRRAIELTVSADGEAHTLRTSATSVGDALHAAGVDVQEGDSIYRDGALVALDAHMPDRDRTITIDVRRAVPFSVVENGQQLQLESSRATVADALEASGVRVGPGDRVQPAPHTEMTAGLEVHVEHARPLVVTVPQGKIVLYTLAETVGEAVTSGAIDLPADYRLEPAEATVVGPGLAVHVVGISSEQVGETERIESQVVYEPDPELPFGAQRVVQGQDGVLHRAYDISYEDGQQTGRTLALEWYDPEPVDTVVYYSTAAEPRPVAPPAASTTYSGDWQTLVCSYSWDCDWALAVINCESGGNPSAYNPSGYVGLFQLWEGHGANLTDPATNIAAAYSLYASGGAGHWPNCP